MNKLPREKCAQILHMLVEGNILQAVTRMTGVSINTVTKLLIDAEKACAEYQDRAFRDLPCRRIQVDEIWSFTYSKQKNVETAKRKDLAYGDTWTWTAICADTKLIPSWLVGGRGSDYAMAFMDDLAKRLAHRVQLTSDGHKAYLEAVEGAFGGDVDYAMLVKLYGTAPESAKGRYSPAECIGARTPPVEGNPGHVSTSYACPATIMIAGPATIMVAGESARRGLSAGGAQPRPETGPCGHGLPVAPVRGGFGPA